MVAAARHTPSQQRKPREASVLSVSSSPRSVEVVPTEFRATCAAANIVLVVRGSAGVQICAQMDRVNDDGWRLALRLPPGRYRYRYYAVHDVVTTYASPADVEGRPVRMQGLDAVLVVPSPKAS